MLLGYRGFETFNQILTADLLLGKECILKIRNISYCSPHVFTNTFRSWFRVTLGKEITCLTLKPKLGYISRSCVKGEGCGECGWSGKDKHGPSGARSWIILDDVITFEIQKRTTIFRRAKRTH